MSCHARVSELAALDAQLAATGAAKRYWRTVRVRHPTLTYDDLVQHGVTACIAEASRYDLRQSAWTTWCYRVSVSRIRDMLRPHERQRKGEIQHITEDMEQRAAANETTVTPGGLGEIPRLRPGESLSEHLSRIREFARVTPVRRRRTVGRPPVPLAIKLQAIAMRERGLSVREIAYRLNVSKSTSHNLISDRKSVQKFQVATESGVTDLFTDYCDN